MFSKETYPFRLPELPYAYHALEPFIDQRTMYFHHDKHLKTYIDNLNKALEAYPEYQTRTLEETADPPSRTAGRTAHTCPEQWRRRIQPRNVLSPDGSRRSAIFH